MGSKIKIPVISKMLDRDNSEDITKEVISIYTQGYNDGLKNKLKLKNHE